MHLVEYAWTTYKIKNEAGINLFEQLFNISLAKQAEEKCKRERCYSQPMYKNDNKDPE